MFNSSDMDINNQWFGAPTIASKKHFMDVFINLLFRNIILSCDVLVMQTGGNITDNDNMELDVINNTFVNFDKQFKLDISGKNSYTDILCTVTITKLCDLDHKSVHKFIPRYAHKNVGFFNTITFDIFKQKHANLCNNILKCDLYHIVKHNLNHVPWTYIIDSTWTPDEVKGITKGILSWNGIFEGLSLGSPFKVIQSKKKITSLCSKNEWAIIDARQESLGTAYFTCDFRTGENLFGYIVLCKHNIYAFVESYNHYTGKTLNVVDYLSCITAHEVGHNLGLRHNFLGYINSNKIDSIMGYYDMMNLNIPDINNTSRDYDINAITYGYFDNNNPDPSSMFTIANKFKHNFGTDENLYERNPYINVYINNKNIFKYVKNNINMYKTYRAAILSNVKKGIISSGMYTALFMNIYNNLYAKQYNIICNFIGGTNYIKNHALSVSHEYNILAIDLLLLIIRSLCYTQEEQSYIINTTEFYSQEMINLYVHKIKHLDVVSNKIFDEINLERLISGKYNITYDDILYLLTFSFPESKLYLSNYGLMYNLYYERGYEKQSCTETTEEYHLHNSHIYNYWIDKLTELTDNNLLYIRNHTKAFLQLIEKITTKKKSHKFPSEKYYWNNQNELLLSTQFISTPKLNT
jgi:hypothetical protein